MDSTIVHSKAGGLEKKLNIPPTQTGNSGDNQPPTVKPTYQGPSDNDPLRYTVPFVSGARPHYSPLPQNYSSQDKPRIVTSTGKDHPLYYLRN